MGEKVILEMISIQKRNKKVEKNKTAILLKDPVIEIIEILLTSP